jgi:hypothetical protein
MGTTPKRRFHRMTRFSLTVAGIAAVATLAIGGAAVAASDDDSPRTGATVAATDSPSPDDSPTPGDTASPDDTASPTDDATTTAPADPGSPVSRGLAVDIALNATGGGTVTEVESEFEHGRAVWKVRIVKDGVRYDVYVDAATGEIIRFRNEAGNDDRGDDHGDDRGGDDHGGNSGHGGGHGRDHAED